MNEEHQVEVGIACATSVEPLKAGTHIVEEAVVFLLCTKSIVEKLSDEEGYGKLGRLVEQRLPRAEEFGGA